MTCCIDALQDYVRFRSNFSFFLASNYFQVFNRIPLEQRVARDIIRFIDIYLAGTVVMCNCNFDYLSFVFFYPSSIGSIIFIGARYLS